MSVAETKTIFLKDYTPAPFHIDTVDLDIVLDARATRVRARLGVRRRAGTQGDLVLDGIGLDLKSIRVDGTALAPEGFVKTDQTLTILGLGAQAVLETEVIIDPQANTSLEGLYLSSETFCTQCEAEGYRKITYHLDRPDILSVYTVRLEADKAAFPVLLSNGNPVDGGDLPGGRHWARWDDPHPKPSYLFALVAGDLGFIEDQFKTRSGRAVTLRIFAAHGAESRCTYAMEALKRAMTWDETRFGLEYDLDVFNIVAVGDFNAGAMENKGLNIFNAALVLASPETATDRDYERIESVVAHEYFHNWTGNRITCRDWFQLCLKEGLTVFRDQEFTADMRDPTVKRIDDVVNLRAAQFPEDGGGLAHPVRPDRFVKIDNFYTSTVYEKGSELVRMLQTMLGRDAFESGLTRYLKDNDGTAATVEDFVTAFEQTSGRDLSGFMTWYAQAGTPRLDARVDHDPESRQLSLELAQSTPATPGQPHKAPVPIPVRLGLIDAQGSALPLRLAGENADSAQTTRVVELDTPRQTFVFEDVADRPVASLLRHFSAPVVLTQEMSVTDRLTLVAADEDPFNRWDAAHGLAKGAIRGAAESDDPSSLTRDTDALIDALGRALDDPSLSPAFLARLITAPSEDDVALTMPVVDPEAVYQAREAFRRRLAARLEDRLAARLSAHDRAEAFRPDAEQAGRRALANGALSLLASLEKPVYLDAAIALARGQGPMTDTLAGLMVIADLDHPERAPLLQAFHDRWQNDPLVLDKWFAIHARSARADTLDTVRQLTTHTAFTLRNPNRVRALIGNFVLGNPRRFHAADGSGYAFFADQVLGIDALNPLFAARLLSAVKSWRRLEPARRALFEQSFQRIRDHRPISDNLLEVVSRLLG